jgi:CheY-like chemotaxis protein
MTGDEAKNGRGRKTIALLSDRAGSQARLPTSLPRRSLRERLRNAARKPQRGGFDSQHGLRQQSETGARRAEQEGPRAAGFKSVSPERLQPAGNAAGSQTRHSLGRASTLGQAPRIKGWQEVLGSHHKVIGAPLLSEGRSAGLRQVGTRGADRCRRDRIKEFAVGGATNCRKERKIGLLVAQTGTGTMTVILTVEDEFLTSEYLSGILEDAGYEVLGTSNADEAIAILEARNDIQIVITDIQLPGSMDGQKLAEAVRGRWPAIKFIVTTGRCRPSDEQMPEQSQFVPKPYLPKGILAAVRYFHL